MLEIAHAGTLHAASFAWPNSSDCASRQDQGFYSQLLNISNGPITLDHVPPLGTAGAPTTARLRDYGSVVRLAGVRGINTRVPSTFVDSETFDNLILAEKAIRLTKAILPLGTGNQVLDIWRTNYASTRATYHGRDSHDHSVKAIMLGGSGNCGEFGVAVYAALASMPHTRPIFLVESQSVDHTFALIGDPREISDRKVVVVDAWGPLSTPHTLDQSRNPSEVTGTSIAPSSKADPRNAIDPAWLYKGKVDVDDREDAKAFLMHGDTRQDNIYNIWTTNQFFMPDFVDEEGGRSYSSDTLPKWEIDRVLQHHASSSAWLATLDPTSEKGPNIVTEF